jgi:hypothetical protein
VWRSLVGANWIERDGYSGTGTGEGFDVAAGAATGATATEAANNMKNGAKYFIANLCPHQESVTTLLHFYEFRDEFRVTAGLSTVPVITREC